MCFFAFGKNELILTFYKPMIVQLCGLSGAGKSTITDIVSNRLIKSGYHTEVIDGDEYRKNLCKDLGFSKEDRHENIRRLTFVASKLSVHGIIAIISAINPYEEIRHEVATSYKNVKTVFIDCSVEKLIKRDTKGLYARALLPDGHPEKVINLTGVNDGFDRPVAPDLYINSGDMTIKDCTDKLYDFILANWNLISSNYD
ncbi:MAG: adenylylsulfate kinase [Mucilaginibacter sp.]|nr:adenylylsulfate kinase [Mucilaginibacter sp.]MDB5140834.1 adenylylsulfate kinase [Mucilaginibacter sp.]